MKMLTTMVKVKVADYQSLPERAGQVVTVNNEEIVLFRLSSGVVKAVENRSPHRKGGTISEALVSGHYIYCPVYDLKVSLEDGMVQAPDEGQIKTYELEITNGEVFVILK